MNNSKIALEGNMLEEPPIDRTPWLRQQEAERLKVIDAIGAIKESLEWKVLKTFIFDGLVETLNRELASEAKKDNPDALKLNRLAGQLKWAEKFSDLDKLADIFRTELKGIREQLKK